MSDVPSSLPQSVIDLAQRTPVEDFALTVLRARIVDVPVQSWIAEDQAFPCVIVRRSSTFGARDPDPRFIDFATLSVSVFCEGIEADRDAFLLSDVVRRVLWEAYTQQLVIPGMGHLIGYDNPTAARRVTDWATSVGPVQYADLPSGVIRYEGLHDLQLRIPRKPFYSS